MTKLNDLPVSRVIGRALLERCPNCGKGPLFISYLKPAQNCTHCKEAYGQIRADDGPAWLTILITGHIVVSLLVIFQRRMDWPLWAEVTFWFSLTIAIALLILPRAKAFFIAMIWYMKIRKAAKK